MKLTDRVLRKHRVVERSDGALSRVRAPARAVVVGGGLAGVSAAMVMAEHGIAVTLIEREAQLGGRVSGWTERLRDGESMEMERGFHAFFRHYYNLRALLQRIDPGLTRLVPLHDYPLLGPDGARESFAGLPRRTPFNFIALAKRSPHVGLLDLLRVRVRPTLEMLAYDPEGTHRRWDRTSARDYLDSLGFPPRTRQMLFDAFAHSFFNREDEFSAGDLLMMFHCYFMANPEGLIFDVLNEPFSHALGSPLARRLEQLGVRTLLGSRAKRVLRGGHGEWCVQLDDGDRPLTCDVMLLAVEVPALQSLVTASPDLDDAAWRRSIAQLSVTAPFAVWRLWLDRPAHPDRAPFAGTTGLGLLDNISIYDRFEGESRRWAARHGGSVIELHAYALPDGLDEEAIRRDLLARLNALYPETASGRVIDDRFLIRRDCPAFAPGLYEQRPTPETPFAGLALAGDFVRMPFPCALMERAVASGFTAANALMARWQQQPEPIWSVPPRGLLAPL